MTGDFTRNTFDPTKNYRRVLMQQGRVMLDADWNEQTSILLHYMRALTADIFGPHAGPASNPGFEIVGSSSTLDTRLTQLVPDAKRRSFLKDKIVNGDALIGVGRYYVNGISVENHNPVLYSEQPGYPFSEDTTLDALRAWKRGVLVYLDVWERHITFEQDDHIREVALGGPDTCSRSQVVWQVKVLLQPSENAAFDCSAVDTLPQIGTGRLRARARLDKPPTELCSIPPESRYRGAENQLYRVEVHKGGLATSDQGGATFKWSRENGSTVFPIVSVLATTAMLATAKLGHLGRDQRSRLSPGDWVEFDDEIISLGQKPRVLAQVETVTRDSRTVTLRAPEGVSSLPVYAETDNAKRPLLRRWDHPGDPKALGGALRITEQDDTGQGLAQGWIALEDGVQVRFAKGGQYQAGDYWIITARTATGDVEWPHERDANGNPIVDSDGNPIGAAVGPRGTHHYYAPILLSVGELKNHDCRCRIERLPCAGYRYAFGSLGIGADRL